MKGGKWRWTLLSYWKHFCFKLILDSASRYQQPAHQESRDVTEQIKTNWRLRKNGERTLWTKQVRLMQKEKQTGSPAELLLDWQACFNFVSSSSSLFLFSIASQGKFICLRHRATKFQEDEELSYINAGVTGYIREYDNHILCLSQGDFQRSRAHLHLRGLHPFSPHPHLSYTIVEFSRTSSFVSTSG